MTMEEALLKARSEIRKEEWEAALDRLMEKGNANWPIKPAQPLPTE